MNLIEEKMPYDSFIGAWYINEKLCDKIVNYHKSNTQLQYQGRSGGEVNLLTKDSIDVSIDLSKDFKDKEIFDEYSQTISQLISLYEEKYPDYAKCTHYGFVEPFPIQHYPIGGGYKEWHAERTEHRNRMLVFMTYLNTIPNAGTEFKYQNVKTECRKGLTLIWPTDPTHTHKGVISNTDEKWIITGWLGYIDGETKYD